MHEILFLPLLSRSVIHRLAILINKHMRGGVGFSHLFIYHFVKQYTGTGRAHTVTYPWVLECRKQMSLIRH